VAPYSLCLMIYDETKYRADIARRIELEELLKRTDCNRYPFDKNKWHTPKGAISIKGDKFFNWNAGIGGGGAISLLMHLNGYDFKSSLDWLFRHFSLSHISSNRNAMEKIYHHNHNCKSKTLRLPSRDDNKLLKIRRYLMHQRCLPKTIVDYLIDRDVLYADDKANAVFLLLGKGKSVVGAEIRGTNDHFRKWYAMAAGTNKRNGCFYIKDKGAKKVVLCESAIDAISYFVIHRKCLAISTSGANPNPYWITHFIKHGFEIFCAFDSDDTGERTANRMRELYPMVERLRPEKQDWNDVLKSKKF
jgi:hypothetical protein